MTFWIDTHFTDWVGLSRLLARPSCLSCHMVKRKLHCCSFRELCYRLWRTCQSSYKDATETDMCMGSQYSMPICVLQLSILKKNYHTEQKCQLCRFSHKMSCLRCFRISQRPYKSSSMFGFIYHSCAWRGASYDSDPDVVHWSSTSLDLSRPTPN